MCWARYCAGHFHILINPHHNPVKEVLPPRGTKEETKTRDCPVAAWPTRGGFWFKQRFRASSPVCYHNCPKRRDWRVSVGHFTRHPEPVFSPSLGSSDHYGMRGGEDPLQARRWCKLPELHQNILFPFTHGQKFFPPHKLSTQHLFALTSVWLCFDLSSHLLGWYFSTFNMPRNHLGSLLTCSLWRHRSRTCPEAARAALLPGGTPGDADG